MKKVIIEIKILRMRAAAKGINLNECFDLEGERKKTVRIQFDAWISIVV